MTALHREIVGVPGRVAHGAWRNTKRRAEFGRLNVMSDVELEDDGTPLRECGGVVKHSWLAMESKITKADVLDNLERPNPQKIGRLLHGGVEVVGPVRDVMQPAVSAGHGLTATIQRKMFFITTAPVALSVNGTRAPSIAALTASAPA
jgi:hypothetical protein